MKIMKVVLVLVLISSGIAAQDQPVQYLIESAASDFHAHGPLKPIHFRNVRFGHVKSSDVTMYMLCGQFTPDPKTDKAKWVPFVTIKTHAYEQYLGDQAASLCKRSSITWDIQKDLSSSLQDRYDSLP
jgi:hypothetical protein